MTGAEVGTFLGSRFNERCGVRSVRPNHRATTVNYHEADCNPMERSGPAFNGSVDSWVALAIPTPRPQRESAFHIPTYIAPLHALVLTARAERDAAQAQGGRGTRTVDAEAPELLKRSLR